MADLYSNYVDSLSNQIDEQFRQRMDQLQTMLAGQGIMQSPASAQYYGDLQKQNMAQMAPVLAQAGLDQRKYQDELARWERAFQAQQAQQAKGDYMQQQQLGMTQQNTRFNQDLAIRQQQLQEAQLAAQQQAADLQNQNWWQEPAGDLLALGAYAVAPGIAPAISAGWNAFTNMNQQQPQTTQSQNRFYQPGVGTDPNTQYYYDPNKYMQVKY